MHVARSSWALQSQCVLSADVGVVPRLIIQGRVGQESMCWLVFKARELRARLCNSASPSSSSRGGKVLQIKKGLSNFFSAFVHPPFQEQCVLVLSISQPGVGWGIWDFPGAICFCRESPGWLEAFIEHLSLKVSRSWRIFSVLC